MAKVFGSDKYGGSPPTAKKTGPSKSSRSSGGASNAKLATALNKAAMSAHFSGGGMTTRVTKAKPTRYYGG